MRYVELVPGIRSSVVGFGCAPILGAVDGATARRAIAVARESGINHFDLARSYGYGEAERFVGRLLRGERDEVVLATKFGLEATGAASVLRIVKPLVRPLLAARRRVSGSKSSSAAAKPANFQPGRIFIRRLPLHAATMRRSLERSLSRLGTGHVDYLFVHEPDAPLAAIDELCAAAARLKEEGKVRAWGLSFTRDRWSDHARDIDRFDVLQFDNSPSTAGYESVLRERGAAPNIFFSPFRGATAGGGDRASLLATLARDFPRSVILCSMFSEHHIRANAAAV